MATTSPDDEFREQMDGILASDDNGNLQEEIARLRDSGERLRAQIAEEREERARAFPPEYVNAAIAFLDRATLQGSEAPTFVEVRAALLRMLPKRDS